MTSVVRRIQFCAAHRLCKHEDKCAHLHGHNYVVCFHAGGEELDDLGRLVDFGVLKDRLGGWIDTHWDHGVICYKEDQELIEAMKALPGQKLFVLDDNPTAENLARYLLNVVGPRELAGLGVKLVRVVLWETENCCAEASQ